ncbi:MAG: siphovirus Gp157 family protein [Gammaproteobacteria bacterium]
MSESMADLSLTLESVLALVQEADGELDERLESQLDQVQEKIIVKAEGIRLWANRNRKAADGLMVLAGQYATMAARRRKAADNVEAYLLHQMQRQGRQVIQTPLFTIKRARIGIPVIDVDFERCNLEDFPAGATEKVPESLKFVKAGALGILRRSERIPDEIGTHSVAFPGGGHVVVQVKERLSVT